MINEDKFLRKIEDFLIIEHDQGKKLQTFHRIENSDLYFHDLNIGVQLDAYKDIILREETAFELGGKDKSSFKFVYALKTSQEGKNDFKLINDYDFFLLGPEVDEISLSQVDFGIFILLFLQQDDIKEKLHLRNLNFISNSIEGFNIRSVPRRFWCKIHSQLLEKEFSFEILANAIHYLYLEKFDEIVHSTKIIIINSYPDSIEKFSHILSELKQEEKKKWSSKIKEWKENVGCDYDWSCEICPYRDQCDKIKVLLDTRQKYINDY